jgi:hypothetical protein
MSYSQLNDMTVVKWVGSVHILAAGYILFRNSLTLILPVEVEYRVQQKL